MMMPVAYAAGVLSSLSDPEGIKHNDRTILAAIEISLLDGCAKDFKKKDYINALRLLYEKVTAK